VQKEVYFHGVPWRDQTEWAETVKSGWNQVVGVDKEKIIAAVHQAHAGSMIAEYGEGNSSSWVLNLICSAISNL